MSTIPVTAAPQDAPQSKPASIASWRFYLMAFATAGVTLFVQVLVHRLVSAKLLNNYAFMVIGLTMLGFAFSGVVLSRGLAFALRRRGDVVLASSALFAASLFAAGYYFCHAPSRWDFRFSPDTSFALQIAGHLPMALPFAIPFAFCGVILGVLLSSPDAPTLRVYCFDLVGSALGAVSVLGAVSAVGVERSLLAAAAVLPACAALLFPPRSRVAWASVALSAAVLAGGVAWRDTVFAIRLPAGSMLDGTPIEHVAWDPVARIELARIPPPDPLTMGYPCLIGTNRQFHQRFQKILAQNNYAFTFAVNYDGRPGTLRGIEETIYAAAYEATTVKSPRVLVIGVGGGFDILTALAYGPSSVVGVEINAATLRILRETYSDYFRPWVDDPRVRLECGEGRHYLSRNPGLYDVLQLSGVDSYSGTPGAAHVFSENYLYTQEAFDLYLSRLTDEGILNVMRLEFAPPREMLRALGTAVAALRRLGVEEPARHVVMLTSTEGNFAALLVKRTPFTAEQEERLGRWASGPYFAVSASPSRNVRRENAYQVLLGASERDARRLMAAYPYEIQPVTDDRPFFFKYSRWSHLTGNLPPGMSSVPVLEYTLLVLLAVIGLAAVLCVALPLYVLHAGGWRSPHAARHTVYFAGIGLGFMAVEMALLQKFGLFLGHPNYAVSVVLAALLLFSGLGSLAATRILGVLGHVRFVAYALAGTLLLEYLLLFPLLTRWVGWSDAARGLLVFALVAPIGILLGTFFPWGLERLKAVAPPFAPWAWGINAIFSVLAPVLSIAVSTTWGMGALLLTAIPVYMIAATALPEAGRAPAA